MNNKTPDFQISAVTPYVGLTSFTENEADYFCGRKSDIENAATNLRAAALTIFYGASGVGKSSLLNAGVIPYLQKIATASVLPGEPPEFIPVVLREWVNNPMDGLRLRIKEAVGKAVKENKISHLAMAAVEDTALNNKQNNNMSDLLEKWTDLVKTDLLIIFDQFEDFFLHPEFTAGPGSFGEEFPKAVNKKDLPVNFMLSLRDDAIAKLDFFRGKIQDPMKNTLRLLHLDREATEEAICKPLKKYNEKMGTAFTIKDDLVKKLLDDVQVGKVKFDTEGQAALNQVKTPEGAAIETADESLGLNKNYQVETPYLQLVMMRLWMDENTQHDQSLTLDTLEKKLGGVQKIVETHLDGVMKQFNDADKELATEFIHFTVTRSGTKIPVDAGDLAELAELPDDRKPDIERILGELSTGETRIFKSVPNRRNSNNPFYEVAHDALGPAILSWRKRENDARRQELALREEEEKRRVEIAAVEAARQAELTEEKRHKEEQAAKLKDEQEQRQYQEKLLIEERRNRKLWKYVVALAILVIAALVVAAGSYFYFYYYNEAKRARVEIENEKNAVSQNLELAEKQNKIETVFTKDYEERLNRYKSLLDILKKLQSNDSETVNTALNRLEEKVKSNDLPNEYKPVFIETLKKSRITPQQAGQALETLNNYKSEPKIEKSSSETPTIIFIQIQKDDSNAAALKKLLEKNDYLAPGIEVVGEKPAIKQIQLRYFRDGDMPLAAEICSFLARHGIAAVPTPIGGYENSPLVRPKQFELWFTGDPIPNIK